MQCTSWWQMQLYIRTTRISAPQAQPPAKVTRFGDVVWVIGAKHHSPISCLNRKGSILQPAHCSGLKSQASSTPASTIGTPSYFLLLYQRTDASSPDQWASDSFTNIKGCSNLPVQRFYFLKFIKSLESPSWVTVTCQFYRTSTTSQNLKLRVSSFIKHFKMRLKSMPGIYHFPT